MSQLEGKVALVTGAGTGIGRGIAEAFAAAGAQVVIAARREGPLREVSEASGGRIGYVLMDLVDAQQRQRALEMVQERHGRMDILVNNAAYQLWQPFADTSEQQIEDLFYTNVTSTTRFIREALPYLEASGGNIVNISSTASRYIGVPSEMLSVYSASKAALNQLTRALAPEFGPRGVRINAVAPGLTVGEYSMDALTAVPGRLEALVERTSLGRVGQPADIARVVLFLASEQAGWVTGQVLDASGGWQIAAG
ncbi:SDR family oxidoreductase [Mangrovimicrobium sediminis]|uniref:SDR family oxidoreductase n=1 Tax=Mangrovimicrobium sediminis TaxID=2562682 RepID=A0A4Z0M1Q7_9GAMM|nr:SDR family oxidoreductase [Haliea sp. SAOS-164]TGD73613.1 SDR family oxidoreductase [Haliea sp. SAOS-164]